MSREVESYSFYRGAADKVKDAGLKKTFTELAGEETKHREFLQGLLAKPVKDLHFDTHQDYKVVDAVPTPPLTTNLKPLDGMVIAIKKELEAMQMYTQLSKLSTDAGQKKLFAELATMEKGHKTRLEDIYTNMAFPEAW
ncbi:MAG: ferritin family protein [Methanomicrobiales archaeon]|nr:ferritin family protein [Methanomicrobiales archaeon]